MQFLLFVLVLQWTRSGCVREFYMVSRPEYECLHYFSIHSVVAWKEEYCLRVDDYQSIVMNNNRDANYSFGQLHAMNVTAYEIFLWSASMDLAEQYQYSLDHRNDLIVSNGLFFNCTSPWFGSRCQYSFEFDEEQWSFDLDISRLTSQIPCYILLECDRGAGSSLCLDWREICDGRIDCLNGGVDEAQCFHLEINECEEKEYRCHNGLCIPEYFWLIDRINAECLDRSDVRHSLPCPNRYAISTSFECEEYICPAGKQRFSCADGQCVEDYDQCDNGRHLLLFQSISLRGNLSYSCWLSMLCLTRLTSHLNETSCDQFLQSSHLTDYLHTCEPLLQFPINPIINGHVHFLYRPWDISEPYITGAFIPTYICYDEHLCDFLTATFRNGSHTCQDSDQLGLSSHQEYLSWKALIDAVKPFFDGCHNRYEDRTVVSHISLYRCQNSSKFISKHHILDNISDCYLHDDERDFAVSCSLNDVHRFRCPGERQCRAPLLHPFGCPMLPEERYNVKRIAFSQLCDGYIDIERHLIDGRNHSDETHCEAWPCKNMYTECDGFWNCPDGTDEKNCRPSNCSGDSLVCISPSTHLMQCLPAKQVQDGIIDCLAGLDELQLCRSADFYHGVSYRFLCLNGHTCIEPSIVCADDKYAMKSIDQGLCEEWNVWNRSELQTRLCPIGNLEHWSFILNKCQIYPSTTNTAVDHLHESNGESENDMGLNTFHWQEQSSSSRCTRGTASSRMLTNNRYTSVCFCPPNYYGPRCQYQNQRVSLTLTLAAVKSPIAYKALIKLIDDDNEREEIHWSDQVLFIPIIDCKQHFDIYLLYSKRPKDLSKNYTIHIDVYDQTHLRYFASWRVEIPHLFLPVNRLALIITLSTSTTRTHVTCSLRCQQGVCVKYMNKDKFFCRCQTGWTGARCHIPIDCTNCSSDSLCVGNTARRSICICPVSKFGSHCLLKHQCPPNYCYNDGLCIVTNARSITDSYLCVCSEQFYGDRCQHFNARLEISLEQIKVSSYLLAYVYSNMNYGPPAQPHVILGKLSTMQSTIILYLPYAYQMVLIKIDVSYYLAVLQEEKTSNISTTIDSTRRCARIDEVFNDGQLKLPEIERLKLYHHLCRIDRYRQCFYDDFYMCLCTMEQFANCFLFVRRDDYQCYQNIHCLNGGQCLQDFSKCPLSTICLCVDCFFGDRCQFYAKGIGLTLDDILRYEIRPHVGLTQQSPLIKVMISFTIIFFVIGWSNSLLSFITFRRPKSRRVGCGLYLFVLSIDNAVTITVLLIKCWFVLLTQMNPSTSATTLRLGCFFLEPLLKFCLWVGNWLNVFISVERAMTTSQGVYFNTRRSLRLARRMIVCLPIVVIASSFYDYISRDLFFDEEEQRAWCVTLYSPFRYTYTASISFFHLLAPFVINLASALFLIYTVTRQRVLARPLNSYAHHLREQLLRHKRLLISPVVLIALAVPLLIFSAYFRCVKSTSNPSLYLCSHFVAFIPCTLTYLIYVLPSQLYRKEFRAAIKDCRKFFCQH